MRIFAIASPIALSLSLMACSPSTERQQATAPDAADKGPMTLEQQQASIEPADASLRSTSPTALAAKQVAENYLQMIARDDFAAAARMWSSTDIATPVTADGLRSAYRPYRQYTGHAELPTFISERDGKQNILVAAVATAIPRDSDERQLHSGTLRLTRPAGQPDAQWKIVGSDLRVREGAPRP